MENQEYYNNLFNQYKVLKEKTTLKVHNLEPTGEIKIQNISSDDLKKRLKVQDELIAALFFLSDDQLIELSGDDFFTIKAEEILRKRKMSE